MKKSDFAERLKNTGRNDPCPCGSKKKYKKCHLSKDEEAQQKALHADEDAVSQEAEETEESTSPEIETPKHHFDHPSEPRHIKSRGAQRRNIPRRQRGG